MHTPRTSAIFRVRRGVFDDAPPGAPPMWLVRASSGAQVGEMKRLAIARTVCLSSGSSNYSCAAVALTFPEMPVSVVRFTPA